MPVDKKTYPIVGIQEGLDPSKYSPLRRVPLREEIDDWFVAKDQLHVDQRALFFPAFLKFQRTSPKDKLSYFQIAGIHGKPLVSWDEPSVPSLKADKGYCPHNSVLFSTWHRPYLLLFEQVIHDLMLKEIDHFPKSEEPALRKAARAWRMPYWDWALRKSQGNGKFDYDIPKVIRSWKVRVKGPEGQRLVENPFYQFTMPGGLTMGDESLLSEDDKLPLDLRITNSNLDEEHNCPFELCKATSRHPPEAPDGGLTKEFQEGYQDNDRIVENLRGYRWTMIERLGDKNNDYGLDCLTADLGSAFYRILTIEKFEDFATKRLPKHGAETDPETNKSEISFASIENLHDNIHDWCGGEKTRPKNKLCQVGHMAHVPVAAFDPIFWIHHCNIDRAIAIWQMLHGDEWFDGVDERDENMGTFTIKRGHKDDPKDILRPFHKDEEGSYWTSDDAREVTALGYTYKGLEKWKFVKDGNYDKDSHLKHLKKMLNLNYNSTLAAAEKVRLMLPHRYSEGSFPGLKVSAAAPHALQSYDYVVNVVYEKFALGGTSFTIHIFIGPVPDTLPQGAVGVESKVGEIFNFSTRPESTGNSAVGCQNCLSQQRDKTQSTGQVILTDALLSRWKNRIPHDGPGPSRLESMEPEAAIEFLRYNLRWRVTSMGKNVNMSSIPSLQVSVAVGRVDRFKDVTKLSRFYDYRPAYEATMGKEAGASYKNATYAPGIEYSATTASQKITAKL